MCGRFVSTTSPDQLADYFRTGPPTGHASDIGARYNVAPTQGVLTVLDDGGPRRLDVFRWGLVPFWAKDPRIGNRMINARAETITEKNSFKRPFATKRCIIAADGFYEWKKTGGAARKQPMYITRVDGAPFAFAGLWDVWDDPNHTDRAGDPMQLHSCTIITTQPNEAISEIHDRMPVMLPPSSWNEWLDSDNDDVDSLARFLVPAPSRLIRIHPVSTEVNNVSNDRPDLIEPVGVS